MRGNRLRLAAIALVAGGLVVGCAPTPPEVTFFGNRVAVTAEPTVTCATDPVKLTFSCPDPDPDKAAALTLRPGDPVEISVPAEVADNGWIIVFRYIDAAGKIQDARTAVFGGDRLAYVLRPPTPQDVIIQAEIQSRLIPISDGYQPTQIWVLVATPTRSAAD